VADGEADAEFVEVCRREHARLVGLLALYTGDQGVAEDLAQEAFVRLHHHWGRVRTMSSPGGWLATVGVNLARSWWRRRFAEQRAHRRHGPAAEATATDVADVLAVRTAVAALPPRQRAALVLRYYAGLSIAETAAALGCADGTVKSLTNRAVTSLRTTLDDLTEPTEQTEPEALPHA
jgi:RNA polymerase sigma-70 factor (sigma-E family)